MPKAKGDTTEQQHHGFDKHERQFKDIFACRTCDRSTLKHGISRKAWQTGHSHSSSKPRSQTTYCPQLRWWWSCECARSSVWRSISLHTSSPNHLYCRCYHSSALLPRPELSPFTDCFFVFFKLCTSSRFNRFDLFNFHVVVHIVVVAVLNTRHHDAH